MNELLTQENLINGLILGVFYAYGKWSGYQSAKRKYRGF